MKLKPKKVRRGRPRKIGGARLNFFPGALKERMDALIEQSVKLRLPVAFTYSYILRQGAQMFIRKTSAEFDKALSGRLHAKRRED